MDRRPGCSRSPGAADPTTRRGSTPARTRPRCCGPAPPPGPPTAGGGRGSRRPRHGGGSRTAAGPPRPSRPGEPGPAASQELELAGRERAHPQEQPSVAEPGDVGGSVLPFVVPDRHVDDLEIEAGRPEEEVEIAEGVEVAEEG